MNLEFTQAPEVPHAHQCGRTSVLLSGVGCGFVWTHTVKIAASMKEYVDAHKCPKCGMGPWYCVIEEQDHGT